MTVQVAPTWTQGGYNLITCSYGGLQAGHGVHFDHE